MTADDPAEARNPEVDAILERYRPILEPLRHTMNGALEESWEEWEIPPEPGDSWPSAAVVAHGQWWKHAAARQREIDALLGRDRDSE